MTRTETSRAADSGAPPADAPLVLVLADDLIWSSRLVAAVERAGARAVRSSEPTTFAAALAASPEAVVVDLTGRGYDGVAMVAQAAAAARPVIAVAQHEDLELRKRALAAGARRVFAYRKLFEDGPAVIAGLLGTAAQGGSGPRSAA